MTSDGLGNCESVISHKKRRDTSKETYAFLLAAEQICTQSDMVQQTIEFDLSLTTWAKGVAGPDPVTKGPVLPK